MSYRIELAKGAAAALARLPQPWRDRMGRAIGKLADDPYPSGSRLLSGTLRGSRRIRVGDYRAVYVVEDAIRVVAVTRVGHRSKVYQG